MDIVSGILPIRSNNTPCVLSGYSERCFSLLTVPFATFHDINFILIIIIIIIIIQNYTTKLTEIYGDILDNK